MPKLTGRSESHAGSNADTKDLMAAQWFQNPKVGNSVNVEVLQSAYTHSMCNKICRLQPRDRFLSDQISNVPAIRALLATTKTSEPVLSAAQETVH